MDGQAAGEIELDFILYTDADNRPTVMTRPDKEEVIVSILDEVDLSIDRADLI